MKTEHVRRYAPFLVLALVQLLFIALAPTSDDGGSSGFAAGFGTGGGVAGGETDAFASPGGAAPGSVAGPAAAVGGSGPQSTGRAPGAAAAAGAQAGGGPATTLAAIPITGERDALGRPLTGDRSKCAGALQEDITLQSPPCMPELSTPNPGATWQGVTDTEFKVVMIYDDYDPAIQTALAANELAMTPEQAEEVHDIYEDFFNNHYNFHGREMVIESYYSAGGDAVAVRANAKEIQEVHKPLVALHYAQSVMSTAMADQLAREGIMAIGVSPVNDRFFIDRHPFVWTASIQGFRFTDMAADFWCKRMAGKNATLAGDPLLRVQPRKLGVGAIENPDSIDMANRFISQITGGMCSTPKDSVILYTQSSDADVRADQFPALVQRMKEDGITTTFNLNPCAEGDNQQYYPENFGTFPVDDDFVGRLFAALCSATQYQNVFGIGMYPRNQPRENKEWMLAAHDARPDYDPPYLAEGPFQGLAFVARLVQYAGPTLNPHTVYEGSRSMPQIAGWTEPNPPWEGWTCCNPYAPEHHIGIAPDSYSTKTDTRQIYWDSGAISEGDNAAGAWVGVDNSRRYRVGQFTPGEPKQP